MQIESTYVTAYLTATIVLPPPATILETFTFEMDMTFDR